MSQLQATKLSYVISPNPQLWYAADAGDAFVWQDNGLTAMFAAHLAEVCEPLAKQLGGLPSLTAILMIVDALSKPWTTSVANDRLSTIAYSQSPSAASSRAEADESPMIAWLVSLSALPTDLRDGLACKQMFLHDVFEGLPRASLEVDAAQAADAIAWLRIASVDRETNYNWPREVSVERCASAMWSLVYAYQHRLDPAAMRLRRRTGLQSLPTAPPIEPLPEIDSYADLLSQLRDDEEFGQLAAMAISTAATISLPRRPSDPDFLPSGGVSDIVNRGHPERLLATELAADPDLLLARIATGQALYIRRESPPKQQPLRRRVLIENGVRMWGVTRVRATALALAVAASEERRGGTELEIMTVAGNEVWAEELSSRAGLLRQLERIEPAIHPGEAILNLLRQPLTTSVRKQDVPTIRYAEPLLIVTANTDRDREYRRIVDAIPRPHLVARVDLDGQLELLKRTAAGDELLQRQKLVLPEKKLGIRSASANDHPLLLSLPECPLRFSADLESTWSHAVNGQTLWLVTKNRRLLCFDKPQLGAIDVLTLPSAKVLASEHHGNDAIDLVVEQPAGLCQAIRHYLIRAHKEGDYRVHTLELSGENAGKVSYMFDSGMLVRIGKSIAFLSLDNGEVLAITKLKAMHLGGVFFGLPHSNLNEVWLASYSAGAIDFKVLRPVKLYAGIVGRGRGGIPVAYAGDLSSMQIFHGDGVDCRQTSVRVTANSLPRFIAYDTQHGSMLVEINGVTDVSGVDPRYYPAAFQRFCLDLTKPGVTPVATELAGRQRLDPAAYNLVSTQSVRNQVSAIGSNGHDLILSRSRSAYLQIHSENNGKRLVLTHLKSVSDDIVMCDFANCKKFDDPRLKHQWNLRRASLGDCTAWLDSRGLLHLRDCNGRELSLVLHDRHLTGWHSVHAVFGKKYFTGNSDDAPVPDEVVKWLRDFAHQCIQ